jgi:hypothetical protein
MIEAQLDKMEDQFSTELLQNCVTQWQTELISVITDSLSSDSQVLKIN